MRQYTIKGYIEETPSDSHQDFELLKTVFGNANQGRSTDLRPFLSACHDQGRTGSCVANAVATAIETRMRVHANKKGHKDLDKVPNFTEISRMHLYYLARELGGRGQHRIDEGTRISLACEASKRFGLVDERIWPFNPTKINDPPEWMVQRAALAAAPPTSAYYLIKSTGKDRVEDVITALQERHPVVFGTKVGGDWFSYDGEGKLGAESDPKGGHAMVIVGYNETNDEFIVRNSWGSDWGNKGCAFVDSSVIASEASRDFWVVRGNFSKIPGR